MHLHANYVLITCILRAYVVRRRGGRGDSPRSGCGGPVRMAALRTKLPPGTGLSGEEKAAHVLIQMLLPEGWLEHQRMTRWGGHEPPLSSRRQEPFKVALTVPYAVILVMASVQPKRRNSRPSAALEQLRIDDFMAWAGPTKPASVEVDSASERARPHPRIGNREYTPPGNASDYKPALVDIRQIPHAAHDGVNVFNCPLEACHRDFLITGIARAVRGQTLAIGTTRLSPTPALREKSYPPLLREVAPDDRWADRPPVESLIVPASCGAMVENERRKWPLVPRFCDDDLQVHPDVAGRHEYLLKLDVACQRSVQSSWFGSRLL
jgi:hypothetical protein